MCKHSLFPRSLLACAAFCVITVGCSTDKCVCLPGGHITSFASTRPVAYSALAVNGKQYAVSVSTYANLPAATNYFNYLIAAENRAGGTPDALVPESEHRVDTLLYRGDLIIYVFGGWGRIRDEHMTTASSAITSPPFGVYPVSPSRFVIMAFDCSSTDTVTIKAVQSTAPIPTLSPRHYVIVNFDSNGVATPEPVRSIPTSGTWNDQDAETAYSTFAAFRTTLNLP